MRDVFKQMPDSLIPYLSSNNRLDFIDFIDSKMDAEVANSLGGKSRMQKLTDKYVSPYPLPPNAEAPLPLTS